MALVSLIVIGLYAGLLRAGRWQTDEYQLFFNEDKFGLRILPSRLTYAPRPFSEALIFLYGQSIERMHRPLVAAFLASLWGGSILAIIFAARNALEGASNRLAIAFALSLPLFAFLLSSSEVTEVFYWPVAAAAYLPTQCAAIVLFFQLAGPLTKSRKLICGGALFVAAASCEMGAALAVGFAFFVIFDLIRDQFVRRAGLSIDPRNEAWWIIPGIFGVAVLTTVAIVRVPLDEATAGAQAHTAQFFYAVSAGIRGSALDLITFNENSSFPSVLLSLTSRTFLALGIVGILHQYLPEGGGMNRRHLALAAALAFATFFSIAAAYNDYGTLCCERQSTTRDGFVNLIFIIGAEVLLASGRQKKVQPRGIKIATTFLILSLLPILIAIPRIRVEYKLLGWAVSGRERSWASGVASGNSVMQFFLPPDSPEALIHGTGVPVGTYKIGNLGSQQLVAVIGRYFGKQIVFVCQPWQGNKAYFIDNKWLLACPMVNTQ